MRPDELAERGLEEFEKRVQTKSGDFWAAIRRSRTALLVLALSTAFMHIRELPESFSSTTLDAAAILNPPSEAAHVRLVTIDEEDYRTTFSGRSPLDPAKLSELLADIALGGPKLVVVDFDTSHTMFRALNPPRSVPVIWAAANRNGGDPPFEPEKPLGGMSPLPGNCSAALDLIPRDRVGIVRKYVSRFPAAGGGYVPSLEHAAGQRFKGLAVNTGSSDSKDNERLLDFRYRIPSISAEEVRQKSLLPGWPHGLLNGTAVILGGTYRAARDRHSTPVRLMDGAEIVAQGVESDIEGTWIPEANPWAAGLLQLVTGFVLIGLYEYAGLRTALLISLVLLPLLSVTASLLLFHRVALWAALLPVLLSLLVTELYSKAALYLSLYEKLSQLRGRSKESPAAGAEKTEPKAFTHPS